MAGKFTHLKYDKQAYAEQLARSTNPLGYRLDPNYAVNCNKCFSANGPRNGHEAAEAIGNKIDVDSILRGYGKINTKANNDQTVGVLNKTALNPVPDCFDGVESEYTRHTHPSFDLRGVGAKDLRLGYPLHDPQCQIFENFGVNTRLQAKDNHRTIWQDPIDQRNLLPTERLGRVKNCTLTLNCSYAPYESQK